MYEGTLEKQTATDFLNKPFRTHRDLLAANIATAVDLMTPPTDMLVNNASVHRIRAWLAHTAVGETLKMRGYAWPAPVHILPRADDTPAGKIQGKGVPLFDLELICSGGVTANKHPVTNAAESGVRFYEMSELDTVNFLYHTNGVKTLPDADEASHPAAGVDEIQEISISGTDPYTISFRGEATGSLAHNVLKADMQTALRALSTIDGAFVTVSGVDGTNYVLTFSGDLAGQELPLCVLAGGAHTIAVDTKGADRALQIQVDTEGDYGLYVEPYDIDNASRVIIAVKPVQ